MDFRRICIIGTGLIGSSLALAFKRQKIGADISGIDQPEVIQAAVQARLFDQGFTVGELAAVIPQADLIILATPIHSILNLLPKIAALVAPGSLTTDVGSTKGEIVSAASRLFQSGAFFLGGHPMAGSEKKGYQAADPFLFENCYYILTPTADAYWQPIGAFSALLEKIGAKVLYLDAAVHDRIAASISHLPQLLATALVNLVGKFQCQNPYYLKMAAGGFRDMTRIASSPFGIWNDILNTNQTNILALIEQFIAELEQLKQLFQSESLPVAALQYYFEQAARTRLSIPHDTKGFLKPLFDLRVVVRDEPGVIAKISTACYQQGINIRDIEVLKVRMFEGGTIRLAFETEKDRQIAKHVLATAGFECLIND
ncbi:prephenate dehydrogenase [candidate division KSB1 bacterium]|nr:prephenate dehydrogenase [candidate division KSB1 bacterium]